MSHVHTAELRTPPGRRYASLVLALALLSSMIFGLLGPVADAYAVGGYHTSANSIRVRAGASTQTAQISSIATAGTPIDIACQQSGETVTASGFGTSAVWDQLNGYGSGYISDLFVQETPYAQFDPRIPRCGASPPPPPPTYVTAVTVAVHTAPSFNASVTGSIATATPVSISCQNYGTAVGGSFIWDYIGNGFVSDDYVNGTPYNTFDSRLPRCGLNYQPVDCSKVLFLGARGSGEEIGPEALGGANDPVQVTRNLLAELGASLDVAGTIYPANSVWLLPANPGAYFAGASQGTAVLLANLRARTDGNVCGWQNTRSVLVGYSQGALVVGDAIVQMTPQERATIVGVVTYGNPRYTPYLNGATGGNLAPGIAGPRAAYPDGIGGRTRDYCRRDIVCSAGSVDVFAHLGYVNPGPQVAAGAAFLAARLGY